MEHVSQPGEHGHPSRHRTGPGPVYLILNLAGYMIKHGYLINIIQV